MPIFFVSYARADAEFPDHREKLHAFIAELSAKVAVGMAVALADVSFMDVSLPAGAVFTDAIGEALRTCRVGIALYSPNYFTRTWCGKEFQVLLDRSSLGGGGGTGIVPVRWAKRIPALPACAERLQNDSGAFPPEYLTWGMHQLMNMRSAFPAKYELALDALADRIIDEANANRLSSMDAIDFDAVRSAWDISTESDPQSHTRGNISKTCFVFASRDGWGWSPYSRPSGQVGALAQKITGELGLKYEEVAYDGSLSQKLLEASEGKVPTVLVGDPTSLLDKEYAKPMQNYDTLYLRNCATIVAWGPESKAVIDNEPRWLHLKTKVCPQKAAEPPPPYHEWRSVFSQEDLESRTRALIEQIRSTFMKQLVSEAAASSGVSRAEDDAITRNAAALGIATASIANLEGPSQ